MKSVRRLGYILPVFLALGFLAACTQVGGSAPPTVKDSPAPPVASASPLAPSAVSAPIKVGILLPLSGQNKALGDAMLGAAQMALFDLGKESFELIPRDTKSSPAEAASAAQSAIDAGAQLILGPVFANDVRAVQPITRSANINMIAFSTDWTLAGGNLFVMGFLPFDQVERVTSYAAAQGIKSTGIVSPANEYGRAVSQAFSKAASAKGVRIASHLNFPEYNPDLQGIVQSLARTSVPMDAVFMPVGGAQASTLADLMSAQSIKPMTPDRLRRIGTGLFDDGSLMKNPNLDGAWFAAPSPYTRARFVERYKSTYGAQPPRLSTLAYDATALSVVLAKRSLEGGDVQSVFSRAAITNPNGFSGIDGIFRFRPNGTAERGLAVLTYENGQITVIDEAPQTFQSLTP
jgi:branched-chain amino acid transport system substrate-binding protein